MPKLTISQYKSRGALTNILMALPILYHLAVAVFIAFGLASDTRNLAADIYSVSLLIEHIWWLFWQTGYVLYEQSVDPAVSMLMIMMHLAVNIGASIIVWIPFGGYTGYNLFRYVSTFGFMEWRKLPWLFQFMYVNIWWAICCTSVVVVSCLVWLVYGVFIEDWVASQKLKRKPPPKESTPAPLIAISTVSPIS